MPDPTPDEPRRTPLTREGITFARGSIADARRALAAARPAPEHVQAAARTADAAIAAAGGVPAVLAHVCPPGRHRPDDDPTPGDRCKDCGQELTWRGPGPHDWDVAEPPPVPRVDPLLIASAVAAGLITHEQGEAALTRGRVDRERADPATGESVARDPAETMRAAADRMRDPYLCNFELGLARRLADWLDSAAIDAEEIGPDFRAERVAAAVLGQPDPHPGVPSPAQVREQLDPATAASLARGLAQSAADDVVDLGDFTRYADDEPAEPAPIGYLVVEPSPIPSEPPRAAWDGEIHLTRERADAECAQANGAGSGPRERPDYWWRVVAVVEPDALAPADAGEGMYRDVYFQIQALLDEALGTDADDGAGEGIVADVRLALTRARQRGAVKAVRRKAADYSSGSHPAGRGDFDVAGDLDGYADAIEAGRLAP